MAIWLLLLSKVLEKLLEGFMTLDLMLLGEFYSFAYFVRLYRPKYCKCEGC